MDVVTEAWDEERFAVGQPVPRKEDPTLLRGEGRYTDDLNLPGQAYAVMVRSPLRAWHHPSASTPTRRARCRACSASTPAPTSPRRLSAR